MDNRNTSIIGIIFSLLIVAFLVGCYRLNKRPPNTDAFLQPVQNTEENSKLRNTPSPVAKKTENTACTPTKNENHDGSVRKTVDRYSNEISGSVAQDNPQKDYEASYVEAVSLQVPVNKSITNCIEYYLQDYPRDFETGLRRWRKYYNLINEKLVRRNMPHEIVWIPFVESGFDVTARSASYAKGMWQLMPIIAKKFGLHINDWVDERVDPELSTNAAMDILEYFHEKLDSWLLAFAAYNAGEGKIFRAIRKVQSRNYWKLASAKSIPAQTRFYVSAILALEHIYRNPDQYAVDFHFSKKSLGDIVYLERQADLRLLAGCAGVGYQELKALNPALKRGWTPPEMSRYPLRIPYGCKERFERELAEIPVDEYVTRKPHVVVAGETLGKIAQQYRSTVSEIMRVNNLKETLIRVGWVLVVPTGIVN